MTMVLARDVLFMGSENFTETLVVRLTNCSWSRGSMSVTLGGICSSWTVKVKTKSATMVLLARSLTVLRTVTRYDCP